MELIKNYQHHRSKKKIIEEIDRKGELKGIDRAQELRQIIEQGQFKLKEFLIQFLAFFEVALKAATPTPGEFSPTKILIEKSFKK